jgi:hypothetical protein
MILKGQHKEWRLTQASIIDVRAVELEQLLTFLWLRVGNGNRAVTRLSGAQTMTVADLATQMETATEAFHGFRGLSGAAEAWLRADLVYTRKRDPNSFTVGRPLHLAAARIRNPKENTDSNSSAQVYSWIHHADPALLPELLDFIQPGPDEELDLPSLGLRLLADSQPADTDRTQPDPTVVPLCWEQARLFTEDLRSILAYRRVLPRSSIVEHIRRLAGLHLGLHLMRMFRIVTAIEQSGGSRRCSLCASPGDSGGRCDQRLDIVTDCTGDAGSDVAKYAEASWLLEEAWISRYVRSHLALKKLHQFAVYEAERGRRYPHETLEQIAQLEAVAPEQRLETYFVAQIADLRNGAPDDATRDTIDELELRHRAMGFSGFRTYHALLCGFAERRWVSYHRWLLDSFLGKNADDGLLRQPLGGRRRRRAVLTPGLLETLVLASAVRLDQGVPRTASLRVDQLIARLAARYGLLIAGAPDRDAEDPGVIRVLADNVQRFKARLRETGLFTDQSDAFLAQTVRPRVRL